MCLISAPLCGAELYCTWAVSHVEVTAMPRGRYPPSDPRHPQHKPVRAATEPAERASAPSLPAAHNACGISSIHLPVYPQMTAFNLIPHSLGLLGRFGHILGEKGL